MARVKRGTISIKRRRNVLKQVKGYRFGRSKKERQAHEAIVHAGSYAFAHRKKKKADFRRLFQTRIGAATHISAISYSRFIDMLKKRAVALDRKILALIAEKNPETFERILKTVSEK